MIDRLVKLIYELSALDKSKVRPMPQTLCQIWVNNYYIWVNMTKPERPRLCSRGRSGFVRIAAISSTEWCAPAPVRSGSF